MCKREETLTMSRSRVKFGEHKYMMVLRLQEAEMNKTTKSRERTHKVTRQIFIVLLYCDCSNTSLKTSINTLFNPSSTEKVVDKPASKFWDHHSTSAINLLKWTCTYGMIYIIGYDMDVVWLVHLKAVNEHFNTKSKLIKRYAPDENSL